MNRDTVTRLKDDDMASGHTIDDVLTLIGFGRFHLLILFTCGLLTLSVTAESMGMGILAPASQCDFQTGSRERAILHGASFLGIICAAYFWGYFCDILGRRKILIWSTILCDICSFLSIFVTSYAGYLCMRFITGIFVAGPASVTLMYLGEFCTHKHRAIVINYMAMFNGIAMIYCPGIAHYITKGTWIYPIAGNWELVPWRLLAFIYILPGILGAALLFVLPESPKFLMSTGAEDETLAVLRRIAKNNKNTAFFDADIRSIKAIQMRETFGNKHILYQMWMEARPIFHEPYIKRFAISCIIITGLFMIAFGIGIWFTEMRNRVLLRHPCPINDTRLCEAMEAFEYFHVEIDDIICSNSFHSFNDSILLGITFIITYIILGLFLLVCPRKQVFFVPLIISSLCGFSLQFVYKLVAIRILYIVYLAFPGVVINLIGSSVVDFIPTYLRGKAMCICTICGRLGVIVGTNVMGNLLDHHCELAYGIFACVPLISAILGYTVDI